VNKWEIAARLTGIGFFIGGSIVLGIWGGLWLDKTINTSFFWIIGLLLGIIIAGWGVYRILRPFLNGKDDNNHHDGRDS
jgi:F0F1-type ATP synthase assembly protein I